MPPVLLKFTKGLNSIQTSQTKSLQISVQVIGFCVGLIAAILVFTRYIQPELTENGKSFLFISTALLVITAISQMVSSSFPIGKNIVFFLMIITFALSFYVKSFDRGYKFLKGDYVQSWNVYHYYMGAKYFKEMGYYDLYKYTFLADKEQKHLLKKVKYTRNLNTYKRAQKKTELAKIKKKSFSRKRWREFKKDLRFLFNRTRVSALAKMTSDHGYNPPPFGNFIFSTLANKFSIRSYKERAFILGLDWLVLIPTFIVLCYAFGSTRGLAVFACFMLFFGIGGNHFGAFFRFHWFCATVIGLCCYKMGHFKTAGFFLAVAIGERIFPILFIAGPGIHILIDTIKNRQIKRKYIEFILSLAVSLGIVFGLSISSGHGLKNWPEFKNNIALHSNHHYTGVKRVGLKRIFTQNTVHPEIRPHKNARIRNLENNKTIYSISVVILACFIFAIIALSKEQNSLFFGILLAFPLTVMSRYYWVFWFLLLLAGPTIFKNRFKRSIYDILVLGLLPFYYFFDALVPMDHFPLYTLVNVYIASAITLILFMLITEAIPTRQPRNLNRQYYIR